MVLTFKFKIGLTLFFFLSDACFDGIILVLTEILGLKEIWNKEEFSTSSHTWNMGKITIIDRWFNLVPRSK